MGRELYAAWPAFARALDEVVEVLGSEVREVMWGEDAAALADTGAAQPAIFAVQVALARALASVGVRPDVVLGHSVGEIAGRACRGVFSLEDAARLVLARGRLMSALPAGGAMLAVQAGEDEVALPQGVSLAAVKGRGRSCCPVSARRWRRSNSTRA
jgi:acyl transferase domain-containing protein